MITIKEMADMIGVSPTTVSNVIHGKTKEVSQKTVEEVLKVVEECNYVPNMNARNLARNDSRIIGIAMQSTKDKYDNFIQDTFTSEIVGALEAGIRRQGYFTMVYVAEDIDEILRLVSTWNVDGMFMLGVGSLSQASVSECEMLISRFRNPIVFLDSYFEGIGKGYVNVGLEDYQGAYDAVRYLIQCGHEKIAFISDNLFGVDYRRFLGYQDALKDAGVPFNESCKILLKPEARDVDEMLKETYSRIREFTALFVVSDLYAIKIMNYLMDRGIQVPEDISIVGFDDNILAQNMRPKLTTVHQNPTEKAEVAVDNLFKMIRSEELPQTEFILPTKLVIRESVKKINK